MAVTNATINENNLVINYNGLNSSSLNGVTIRYELKNSNGSNVLRGQATISIIPGENQSVIIALNGNPSGQSQITLSNNDIVFYNSNIGG